MVWKDLHRWGPAPLFVNLDYIWIYGNVIVEMRFGQFLLTTDPVGFIFKDFLDLTVKKIDGGSETIHSRSTDVLPNPPK